MERFRYKKDLNIGFFLLFLSCIFQPVQDTRRLNRML